MPKPHGKSSPQTPTVLRKPKHGRGRLRVGGKPGNKGGTGRPPDEFQRRMRELATYAEKQGYVEEVLADTRHPHWMRAVEFVTERGYGKTPQTVVHEGDAEKPITVEHKIKWGNLEVPL